MSGATAFSALAAFAEEYPELVTAPPHHTTIACVVVAHSRRRDLVQRVVLPSVVAQGFDEIVCVGDWPENTHEYVERERYRQVAPLTDTTVDALVKRDVGTLTTYADILVYLCDDHALAPNFLKALREVADEPWDVLVPNRYTETQRPLGSRATIRIDLPMGEAEAYCAGHAGVFRRGIVKSVPWSAMPHHRNWDVLASYIQSRNGARFCWRPRAELAVIDLEPQAEPWK